MHKALLYLIFVLIVYVSHSQNNETDSLKAILEFAKPDSNKVNALITLSSNYELTIMDSAFAVTDNPSGGVWNVIEIANVDEDDWLEVVYTSSTSVPYSLEFSTTNVSAPVIIMEARNNVTSVSARFTGGITRSKT